MLLILFFLIVIVLAIISLKIRVNIKDIQVSNIDENQEKTELKNKFCIEFQFFIFEYLKIAKIKFDNEKVKKIFKNVKYKMKDINMKKEIRKEIKNRKEIIKAFKNLKIKLKELNFNLGIGIEGITGTIGIFTTISTIVPILIRNNASKVQYTISPIYNIGNVINFWANSIVDVYLVYIIYAIYSINMKGRKKNVRGNRKDKSSDRRAYDYSNG